MSPSGQLQVNFSSILLHHLQHHARYLIRHMVDSIALQGSVYCKFPCIVELGKEKYSTNTIPRGMALKEVALGCLQEIENELF